MLTFSTDAFTLGFHTVFLWLPGNSQSTLYPSIRSGLIKLQSNRHRYNNQKHYRRPSFQSFVRVFFRMQNTCPISVSVCWYQTIWNETVDSRHAGVHSRVWFFILPTLSVESGTGIANRKTKYIQSFNFKRIFAVALSLRSFFSPFFNFDICLRFTRCMVSSTTYKIHPLYNKEI